MASSFDEQPVPIDLFGLVWTGWFWGTCAIFLPIFVVLSLIGIPISIAGGEFASAVGILAPIVMVPLIAAGQGVLVTGLVLLGLWVRRRAYALRGSGSGDDQVA